MQPPHPCESLERLVDRLNEQLDALCSQNQEHGVLQSLIDIRSLTDMTRAMLKDTGVMFSVSCLVCRNPAIPAGI